MASAHDSGHPTDASHLTAAPKSPELVNRKKLIVIAVGIEKGGYGYAGDVFSGIPAAQNQRSQVWRVFQIN
jgi:hypothetical protein